MRGPGVGERAARHRAAGGGAGGAGHAGTQRPQVDGRTVCFTPSSVSCSVHRTEQHGSGLRPASPVPCLL